MWVRIEERYKRAKSEDQHNVKNAMIHSDNRINVTINNVINVSVSIRGRVLDSGLDEAEGGQPIRGTVV